jgi:hypothetical protein
MLWAFAATATGVNNIRMFAELEIRPSKMFCPQDSPALPAAEFMGTHFDVAKRVEGTTLKTAPLTVNRNDR